MLRRWAKKVKGENWGHSGKVVSHLGCGSYILKNFRQSLEELAH